MKKRPFVTLEKLKEIEAQFPTPFIFMMKRNPRKCKSSERSICMESGLPRVFCSKSNSKPVFIKYFKRIWMCADCSSMTELMLSHEIGMSGEEIMFSSNDTPAEELYTQMRSVQPST